MSASLVGSEMCIRDSPPYMDHRPPGPTSSALQGCRLGVPVRGGSLSGTVSYTHLTLPTICSV
eukprot:13943440-Alexandrium_andersonii.AAC.1